MEAEKMQELSAQVSKLRAYLKDRDLEYATDVFICVGGILDVLNDIRYEDGAEKDVAAVEKEGHLPDGFSHIADKLIIALRRAAELMDSMQELFERKDTSLRSV